MKPKHVRVLLTQHRLVDFTGSEIITLEMAEYFSRQGAEVLIATTVIQDPIKKYFDSLKNVTIYEGVFNNELEKTLTQNPPDIAWIHHQLIPPALLEDKALKKTTYLFNHMSSYYFQEFPIAEEIESILADKVLYNSQETKGAFEQRELLQNVKLENKVVLDNPAPDQFFELAKSEYAVSPKKVLIVSNHIPEELWKAVELLESQGIEVDIAGISKGDTKSYDRITPERIKACDVVISIGKTVQYSLANATPIYCYDHFGGPGYISSENYEKARALNFSGRGFGKKRAEEIVRELTRRYSNATQEARGLCVKYGESLTIGAVIPRILEAVEKSSEKKFSVASKTLYLQYLTLLDKLFTMERDFNTERKNSELLTEQIRTLEKEKQDILESKTYKTGLQIKRLFGKK